MLDPAMYRRAALIAPVDWEIHYPQVFKNVGFPIHIESFVELGQLIDTMQENRFYAYQAELSGLTEHDYKQVTKACVDIVLFQLKYLPYQKPILPLSTVMAFFCLYRKLLGACPNFERVLEIGPGCGYLSFLLKGNPHLKDYSQIESCESFYILQNLINIECFGPEFKELAIPEQPATYTWSQMPHPVDPQFSPVLQITIPPVCTHYPCWRLDEVRQKKFDLVTSNANLLEFTPEALDQYLKLIHEVLDGFLIVQCVGNASFGTPTTLRTKLQDSGFAVIYYKQNTTIDMLITKDWYAWDKSLIDRIYKPNPMDRKTYHPRDFVKSVEEYFAECP